jgi:hypothetical protein
MTLSPCSYSEPMVAPDPSSAHTMTRTSPSAPDREPKARREESTIRLMRSRWLRLINRRSVRLPGANLYMFLSNEADVIREVRSFAATLDE